MGFKINTNLDALKAYQQLANANKMTSEAQLRMASGKRIQSVSDDTSGFNIGTSLKGKVSVMKGAQGNIASAKNLMSTAEGALLSVNDLLVKIEGKMADSTNPMNDRTSLANDIKALATEIDSIINNTKFNDTKLFATSAAQAGFAFQTGESSDTINLTFARSLGCSSGTSGQSSAVAATLGSFTGVAASTLGCTSGASSLLGLTSALGSLKSVVSDSLGQIGNFTQRLDIKDDTLNVAISNAESSISRLFDADMAMEQLQATRGSILQQASTAMFAQLNFAPQQVLQLFG